MRHVCILSAMVLLATPAFAEEAAEPAPPSPLMMGLEKIGAGEPLKQANLQIYGWVDGGYTWDHRPRGHYGPAMIGPVRYDNRLGPGNHAFLNQFTVRFERTVASDKFDVGGLVEFLYGADSAAIHSNGMSFGNETRTGKGGSPDADDRYHPIMQFDIPQAYVEVNIPVAKGLRVRAGKFYALMGYESIDPRSTPFYSRSYLFNAVPYTMSGICGYLTANDQLDFCLAVIRGSDQSLEDNNGAISAVTQMVYKPNKDWKFQLNLQVGPEDDNDTSHYRVSPDFIVTWQATEKLSFAMELLYMYDGGRNGAAPTLTHAYGDVWGTAIYSSYVFNDYCTGNLRFEKYHDYANSFNVADFAGTAPTVNVYALTLGVTLHPFPKDPILKNLVLRPETRYDFSEDRVFYSGDRGFRDQWTFAADVIFAF